MWYARPMRVDTEALARVKSILAESLRESEEPGRFKQEPTPLRSWDVDCPWCGAIGLLIVKAHPHWPQAFDGGFSCAKCHKTAMRNGQARDADAYGSALMTARRRVELQKRRRRPQLTRVVEAYDWEAHEV